MGLQPGGASAAVFRKMSGLWESVVPDDLIDAYPHFLNRPIDLVVDERPLTTRITAAEWMDCWRPVLQKIMALHLQRRKRILIGIGGPPGAGKSVFAAQLHWIICRNVLKHCHAVALS